MADSLVLFHAAGRCVGVCGAPAEQHGARVHEEVGVRLGCHVVSHADLLLDR